jgi:hypothetical protein
MFSMLPACSRQEEVRTSINEKIVFFIKPPALIAYQMGLTRKGVLVLYACRPKGLHGPLKKAPGRRLAPLGGMVRSVDPPVI